MHDGDPLLLIGLEQGGNDLRSLTPALANSDREAKQLNPDDLYERTIAMYDKGAHFNSAPLALGSEPTTRRSRPAGSAASPQETAPRKGGTRFMIIATLLGCLFAIGALIWRRENVGSAGVGTSR